jgi:DNA-binding transcriptional LysR family regulator
MELRNLRHFAAVADTLNFRIAGERLHLTQPALTRSIAALERELGVQLFHRDKRHVALTTDGAQLLERARDILTGADQFAYAAHSLSASTSRVLRVGVYGNGLAELTHPLLQAFCERYPATAVQVRDADFARGIDPLFTGEYHVALLRAPVNLPQLRTVRLFLEPLHLLLWQGHPLANVTEADVSEFFDEPWVALPPKIPGAWGSYWLCAEQRGEASAIVGAYARTETEFSATVAYRKLVGLLPASASRLHPHPTVRSVLARGAGLSPAAVAHPVSGYEPAAAAFADVAAEVVRRQLHLVPLAQSPDPS